jgi:putative ABC transport system permease protein
VADLRLRTEVHLLRTALWRRRGTVSLAVLAVAIGASVASALLHVSGDVGRKVTRELRSLGPNLLLVPASETDGADGRFLDEAEVRERLEAAGLDGVPLLYVVAEVAGRRVPLVGADLAAARRLHPAWQIGRTVTPLGGDGDARDHLVAPDTLAGSLMGKRLMARLGVDTLDSLTLRLPGGPGEGITLPAGAWLDAGGPDDEAWWIPLATAQALTGLAGRVSVAQARVDGGAEAASRAAAALERGGTMRALVLHALSATEGRLLARMRRLMALVTVAALVAAGLCAFGTLTDLALERRREIALMKALGATAGDVIRLFVSESLAIGALGGLGGWLIGVFFAQVIGREVFHSTVALRWDVPLMVLALAMSVAIVAGLGPIRLALAVEPAPVLKGD